MNRFQDEMEELRSEMLEMRDMYMEDDVYQLQELRQQLEQVRTSQSLSVNIGKCFKAGKQEKVYQSSAFDAFRQDQS